MGKTRQELVQTVVEKMTAVIKSMHTQCDFPFGEFKLSRPQVMILFFIEKKKSGASVKDLATFLRVTPGAITQFIDVLVKEKLLVRHEDPSDRRTLKITLTKFARSKITQFKKNYFSSIVPVFKNLTDIEIANFLELIDKILI